MAKMKLDRTWIYAGVLYGPGEVELPANVAESLQAKGAGKIILPPPPSADDGANKGKGKGKNE